LKLTIQQRVPSQYDRRSFVDIIRALEEQVNQLAEGKVFARHAAATAAPTTGTHARGDITWNSEPSASGYVGWVCVTAGTPGTWKGFGVIQA